jgi:peptidoglycan/LPS O-acetylase OafA/YrhL
MQSVAGGGDKLLSLQILRAVAALGVLAWHVQIATEQALGLVGLLPSMLLGCAGVDLFFVISGFIMVHASSSLFGRREVAWTFFARRLARIAPLYWLMTGLIVVVLLRSAVDISSLGWSWTMISASLLFIPYPRPDGEFWPVLEVGWTLNYEMFFYLVFAASLVLPRRLAVGTIAALFCTLVILRSSAGPWPAWFEFLGRPIILEFCFGMALALSFLTGFRLPRFAAIGLIAGACICLLASGMLGADALIWRAVLWGIPAAAIVAGLLSLMSARRTARIGLHERVLAFLGDASYSIYLIHLPIVLLIVRPLRRAVDPTAAPWFCVAVLFIVPIIAAVATYFVIERPVTRWLHARIRFAPPAHAQSAGIEFPVPATSAGMR